MELYDALPIISYSKGLPTEAHSKELDIDPRHPTALIFCENYPHYTGGRYHMFQYCVALCALGYQVVYLTDMRPPFTKDYVHHPGIDNLKIVITGWRYLTHKVFAKPLELNVSMTIGSPPTAAKPAIDAAKFYKAPSYMWCFIVPPLASKWRQTHDTTEEYWFKYKKQIERADHVITVSHANRDAMPEWVDKKRNRIHVVHPAINERAISMLHPTTKRNSVVFLSRLVDYKHPEFAYELVKELRGYELHFIGGTANSPFENEVKRLAELDKVNVQFHTAVSDKEKYKVLNRAKVLIYPTEWEDFGMPPAEAGAMGVATCTFDMPTLRDHYGDTLMYAEHGNFDQLREIVSHALVFEKERRLKAEACRKLVMDTYTMRHMVEQLKEVHGVARPGVTLANEHTVPDNSVLIERMDKGMGDILMYSTILPSLKAKGYKFVAFRCRKQYHDLLARNPHIDLLLSESDRVDPQNFSDVIQLNHFIEDLPESKVEATNRIDLLFEELELKRIQKAPEYIINEKLRERTVKRHLGNFRRRHKKIIVLHTQSAASLRSWPVYWIMPFCDILSENNIGVILVGNQAAYNFDYTNLACSNMLNLCGELSLDELAIVLDEVDLVVGVDSGITHLAGAIKKPCLALFGTIDPALRVKDYATVEALYETSLPCQPCNDCGAKMLSSCKAMIAENQSGICMTNLTPDKVARATREWLDDKARNRNGARVYSASAGRSRKTR
jgi:ADP-heptose:LPS heptosyltransferase/glycosyltransferase involved in cell wall biosynthesis